MNSQKKRIQQLTLAAFFVAIEVIMSVTPIGYIPVGALSITTMHLPVILAGVLLGPEFGAGIGFVFGLTSCVRATMQPGITSFVFTPFVQVGNMHGNAFSLLIAFGPRILLGYLSGMSIISNFSCSIEYNHSYTSCIRWNLGILCTAICRCFKYHNRCFSHCIFHNDYNKWYSRNSISCNCCTSINESTSSSCREDGNQE